MQSCFVRLKYLTSITLFLSIGEKVLHALISTHSAIEVVFILVWSALWRSSDDMQSDRPQINIIILPIIKLSHRTVLSLTPYCSTDLNSVWNLDDSIPFDVHLLDLHYIYLIYVFRWQAQTSSEGSLTSQVCLPLLCLHLCTMLLRAVGWGSRWCLSSPSRANSLSVYTGLWYLVLQLLPYILK